MTQDASQGDWQVRTSGSGRIVAYESLDELAQQVAECLGWRADPDSGDGWWIDPNGSPGIGYLFNVSTELRRNSWGMTQALVSAMEQRGYSWSIGKVDNGKHATAMFTHASELPCFAVADTVVVAIARAVVAALKKDSQGSRSLIPDRLLAES